LETTLNNRAFAIIGENIHTTRVLLQKGKRIGPNHRGEESVLYKNALGEDSFLVIPQKFKETQVYKEGRVKHFMIAVQKGISDNPDEQKEGEAYILSEIRRQERYGSTFLDLNVDEISHRIEIQKEAMSWLVNYYCEVATLPPSIDSSSLEILQVGLEEYDKCGKPQGSAMVNSASLERIDALDFVEQHECHVIVTAAALDGMPSNSEERVENASEMVENCLSKDISLDKIHVDLLLFPISVDQTFGNHYLDAVRDIREKYGDDIYITGGLSNVSFGLPMRRLINETFIRLAIDAGIDSGIINPVENRIERIMALDIDSERVQIARDMLLGHDEFCMNYISSYRDGKLASK
tara:strand:+ start:1219 stop:2271 length:1053 start_codon:yes stop_codon:yes gene_type:complete